MIATIIPLHKEEDILNLDSCRQILLPPCFIYFFKNVLYKHIVNYFKENNLLNICQFDFRWNKSTIGAILSNIDEISNCLDTGDKIFLLSLLLKHSNMFRTVYF